MANNGVGRKRYIMSIIEDINWPIHHTTVGPIAAYPLGFVEPPRLEFMQHKEPGKKKITVREQILKNAKEYVDYGLKNGLLWRPDGIKNLRGTNASTLKVIESLEEENRRLNDIIAKRDHKISTLKDEIRDLQEKRYGSFSHLKY
jgi:hypothetical protein